MSPTSTDAAPSSHPDAAPGRGSPPGAPRWVKASGFVALVAVVLSAVMLLAGGGHGPGRHAPPAGGHAPR